jgi:hypothetical protein
VSNESLPPTFSYYFAEFPDTVDLTVVYRVGVKVEPGIDLRTVIPERDGQPEVVYDLARIPEAMLSAENATVTRKTSMQSQTLLPDAERSSRVQSKLKAVFTTSPTAPVEISCTVLQRIFPGYKPRIAIGLRGEGLAHASVVSFRADLMAYTWCKTDKRLKGPFERSDHRTMQKLACRTLLPLQFSKENDHTVSLEVDALYGWTSTFKHSQLAREYKLRIKMKLKVAQKSISFDREVPVTMVPPPREEFTETADEDLPSYHDASAVADSMPPKYG